MFVVPVTGKGYVIAGSLDSHQRPFVSNGLDAAGHTDLGGLCSHQDQGDVQAWAAAESLVLICVPAPAWVCDDVRGHVATRVIGAIHAPQKGNVEPALPHAGH